MTPTLVRQHPRAGDTPGVDPSARARDWSEIQERMLVPLYEAVHDRLDVGPGTRLLGLGCGSGLALLMAASRGATVTGVEPSSPERLTLARDRLHSQVTGAHTGTDAVLGDSLGALDVRRDGYDLVTAFEPIGCRAGDSDGLAALLTAAAPRAARGAAVVLAGWGPPERCATTGVLRVADKLADPSRGAGRWRPALRDDLEEVAERAGLRPDGSGRVACPFGYADLDSAVRGLLSTGLFDAAVDATDRAQVDTELREALRPYRRQDRTVWMPNVFRYLIARVPQRLSGRP
ncbi:MULTISPECIES: SAM-dependent methyltransferase [Streptomyces]|uniref:SAM-dependent methyltransferase n=1 Tax=Streptomyces TaxID=1883 RepID=UPI000A3A9955|nr:SAM-dependent methyltransferase [Streptomyces glaucescens]